MVMHKDQKTANDQDSYMHANTKDYIGWQEYNFNDGRMKDMAFRDGQREWEWKSLVMEKNGLQIEGNIQSYVCVLVNLKKSNKCCLLQMWNTLVRNTQSCYKWFWQ
jgi:hypothetical protein